MTTQFKTGQRVWILVAGDRCPGIISDPEEKRRDLPRRGGLLSIPNSVVAISYRMPPTGPAFYTERPEAAGWIMPREDYLAVIDSQVENVESGRLIAALPKRVGESMLALQQRLAAENGREVTTTDWSAVKAESFAVA